MKILIILSLFMASITSNTYKIDFGQTKDGEEWVIVNDGVMGGKSESEAQIMDNSIFFKGNISLKNNGGFASLRNQGPELNISSFTHVKIRFKANTKRQFSFRMSSSDRFYQPFFKHNFGATGTDWQTSVMPISDFKEYNLNGETGRKIISKSLEDNFRIGIILYDKQEGQFELEIDFIEFY